MYTWQNASVRTGPMRMDYTYDNLYQLKSATGEYRPDRGYGYDYSSTFQYDEIANLTKKAQLERRLVWDNQNPPAGLDALDGYRPDHTVSSFSYTLDYKYQGSAPHAANKITETSSSGSAKDHVYSYDTNGNNTGNTYMGGTRVLTWDEENRLKQVTEAGSMRAKFLYSPDGERTQKQTQAGDSFYVNQFFTVKPSGILPTKHIFAGETRIVSKTDPISQVPMLSFYHPDHLGSTSYTSGSDQTLLQHERYFPFGERDIGDQEECDLGRPDNMRRDWIFNSKELDFDTGYYYFGARYYDPKTSVWQSPDPILGSYMRGEGRVGGVYRPSSLGLYTYSRNNPIVLRDPDGRESGEVALFGAPGYDDFVPSFMRTRPETSAEVAVTAAFGVLVALGLFAPEAVPAVTAFFSQRPNMVTAVNQLGQAPGVNLPVAQTAKAGVEVGERLAAEGTLFGTKQAARQALDGPLGVAANRFFRDAAKNAERFRISDLTGGGKRFEFFSAARNAGYGKQYVQEVDGAGAVLREFKNTLGPNGLIETQWVHGGR